MFGRRIGVWEDIAPATATERWTVYDGAADSNIATVTINVTDQAPSATDVTYHLGNKNPHTN